MNEAALALRDQVERVSAELGRLDEEIAQLTARRAQLLSERRALNVQLEEAALAGRQRDWSADTEWTPRARQLMREYFGIAGFRELQHETINALMAGEDVLLVLRSGGGKSLTYQLPALLMPGVVVVISPLVALMHDQASAVAASAAQFPCAAHSRRRSRAGRAHGATRHSRRAAVRRRARAGADRHLPCAGESRLVSRH